MLLLPMTITTTMKKLTSNCQIFTFKEFNYDSTNEHTFFFSRMRILTLSCSSDLCNYVDANYLSTISSATGACSDNFIDYF